MTKEIEKATPRALTPLDIVNQAMTSGHDISMDQIEKLYELHERNERNEARKAFYQALTEFKKVGIRINKDKQGHNCTFASLPNILDAVVPVLSDFDLSLTWKTRDVENGVEVTAVLTHVLGHSQESTRTTQYDTSGGKNHIQAGGSAQKYLMRYTAEAILGIAAHDRYEDDGIGTEDTITQKQVSELTDIINSIDIDEKAFYQWCSSTIGHAIMDVSDIPSRHYGYIRQTLLDAKGKKK